MILQQWALPCRNKCTNNYAKLMQIPCLEECNELCYKDPVLKDREWSAYFNRSPGAAGNSEECFHSCVSGCGYKFDIPTEKVDEVCLNRPPKPPPLPKPTRPPFDPSTTTEDVTNTYA